MLEKVFNEIDRDGNGSISEHELFRLLFSSSCVFLILVVVCKGK